MSSRKTQAQERYEDAIIEGDTLVMIESAGKDLCSANLGNLLPGEEASIELEYGQILNAKDGEPRMSLPSTLARRYGESSGTLSKATLRPSAISTSNCESVAP